VATTLSFTLGVIAVLARLAAAFAYAASTTAAGGLIKTHGET